jgi:hypothetical protein
MRRFLGTRGLALVGALVGLALVAPAAAMAATVVNGDFESGLTGWQRFRDTMHGDAGNWFVYSGTEAPLSSPSGPEDEEEGVGTLQAPPQGTYAATTDEEDPGDYVLYQDVALEPFYTHRLSMTLYYRSFAPIGIPSPDSLSWSLGRSGQEIEEEEEREEESVELEPNQQYRVDVMKPSAPIDSLDPADILSTVFATRAGDAQTMAPREFSADLTPFAGQTVRLRFANVDNQYFFNAGVDDVSITSVPVTATPPAPTAPAVPSNAFKVGRAKLNPRKGTAKLPVTVSGPGTLSLTSAPLHKEAPARRSWHSKPLVRPVSVTLLGAGTLPLIIRPTKAARKLLRGSHKLRVGVDITFTPTGGTARIQNRKLTLRLRPKRKHHRHHTRR